MVDNVILVAIVDALEMHHEAVVVVVEPHLSLLHHLVKPAMPCAVSRYAFHVDVCDSQGGLIEDVRSLVGRDDDGALVAAEDEESVAEGCCRLPLVLALQTLHIVDVDNL